MIPGDAQWDRLAIQWGGKNITMGRKIETQWGGFTCFEKYDLPGHTSECRKLYIFLKFSRNISFICIVSKIISYREVGVLLHPYPIETNVIPKIRPIVMRP